VRGFSALFEKFDALDLLNPMRHFCCLLLLLVPAALAEDISFEPNRGQAGGSISFFTRVWGGPIFFASDGTVWLSPDGKTGVRIRPWAGNNSLGGFYVHALGTLERSCVIRISETGGYDQLLESESEVRAINLLAPGWTILPTRPAWRPAGPDEIGSAA
jgi:hypothetical protein